MKPRWADTGPGGSRNGGRHRCAAWRLGCLAVWLAGMGSLAGQDWPTWRGPRGNGTASETAGPLVWSARRNIRWKVELEPWGNSTPVVGGRYGYLTLHADSGDLVVQAFALDSGRTVWRTVVGNDTTPRGGPTRGRQHFHRLHNLASPSPATDGRTLVVHFGNGWLVALDAETGHEKWRHDLQKQYGPYTVWWGHANSPVIHDGLVLSICIQDSLADVGPRKAKSYVVAHDLETGQVRWLTERPTGATAEAGDAYTTPLLVPHGDRWQLVVMGADQLDAYDPRTGKRIWYVPGLKGGRTVASPTWHGDWIVAAIGKQGSLFALRPLDRFGRIERSRLAWEHRTGTPDTCSPVIAQNFVLTITDRGVARCYHLATGKLAWVQRLRGEYKASPVAAGRYVYFLNTTGLCTVVAVAPRYVEVARNALPASTFASPVLVKGHLLIRGRQTLWCIGNF